MQTTRRATPRLLPAGSWSIDPSSSHVGFTVRKLGTGRARGEFGAFEGTVATRGDGMWAAGSVRVASLDTGNADRDAHLLADNFFAAGEFPEIRFRAHTIQALEAAHWSIVGELTIRDHAQDVELIATRAAPEDGRGQRLLVLGEIDRKQFGLTWNRAVEATGVVGATVGIDLDLTLVKTP